MFGPKQLLKTFFGILLGMAFFLIGVNIPGFPIWLFAFSIAVLSFILAFYYQRTSKVKPDAERRYQVQIFTFFGIISLLLGMGSLIMPVPQPGPAAEFALIIGALFGLLLGLLFLRNQTT